MEHGKENPDVSVEDSIGYIKNTTFDKGKEFVELFISDGYSSVPKFWKELHLATLKPFWMLYNSTNKFDSPTALLQNINMAIYDPLEINV